MIEDRIGKRVAIVGGGSGMGFAAARILAGEGGSVVIIGRDATKTALKADELSSETGGRVFAIATQSAARDGVGDAVRAAVSHLGGLDGLAVTAGPMGHVGTLLELADIDWLAAFETQLMTVVRATRAALPALQESHGRLVTIAAYSIRAQKSSLPHYAAMKSAVASLTKNIAKTYGPMGVQANCIAPGAIATEALDQARDAAVELYGEPADAALNRFMKERWGMNVALDRVGRPEEVGELIAFLLSGRAGYLTGSLINIDGGTDF